MASILGRGMSIASKLGKNPMPSGDREVNVAGGQQRKQQERVRSGQGPAFPSLVGGGKEFEFSSKYYEKLLRVLSGVETGDS